jgi:hypothetical protein
VVIQAFGADPNIIEIIGRCLWHNCGKKENVEAAYRLYRKAEYSFPDIAKIKLLRASCFTYLSPDPTAFVELMDSVKKNDMPFLIRFLYFKRNYDAKRQGSGNSNGLDNNNKLDLVAYVEFQKYYA